MKGPERVVCQVESDADPFPVQHEARRLAERSGFSRRAAAEIAIVASELASNILKYGVRGVMVMEAIEDPDRGSGVRLSAYDEGLPFSDFEQALRDGCDERGSLDPAAYAGRRGFGTGLGTVRRFSDACGWKPEARGKQVWALRFRKAR